MRQVIVGALEQQSPSVWKLLIIRHGFAGIPLASVRPGNRIITFLGEKPKSSIRDTIMPLELLTIYRTNTYLTL